MTKAQEQRMNELARDIDFEVNGEIYSPYKSITYATYDDMECAFKLGFRAALAEKDEAAEKLADALSTYKLYETAKVALTEYRKARGEV